MSSLTFPDSGSRQVLYSNGNFASGATAVLYTAQDVTHLAAIFHTDSTPITGSALTLDAYGRLPDFLGPTDGTDRLWVVVNGGPPSRVDADYNARIDAVDARVTAVESGGNDALLLHKAGAETVTGVKTFTTSPAVPTPIGDSDVAPKAYVDAASGTVASDLGDHVAATTTVHGIADTSALETQTGAQAKADAAQTNAITASQPKMTTSSHATDFTATVGIIHLVDTTTGAVTGTLPAANVAGQQVELKLNAGVNPVNLAVTGSDTIGPSATSAALTLAAESWLLTSSGAGQWNITGGNKALSSLDGRYLQLAGGTLTGSLAVGDGTLGRTVTLASSFAGGENTTDSTSRIDLYSYQRAQKNAADGITPASFGEVIRIYSRRWDSKQMVAWYGPTSYDPTTHLPADADTVWFWMGAHYEANDHGSVHGHWSVEVPDSTGQMQTRMELRIWDPVTGQFGMDRTILKVNAADMIVACDNGSLQIGASAGTNKNVYFTNDTLGAVSGRRWLIQADSTAEAGLNVGTDFRLLRYSDAGSQIDTALFVKRSTGQVGVGNIIAPAAKLDVSAAGSYHTVQAAQTTTSSVTFAAYSAQLGLAANRLFDGRVIGDGSARIVIKGDGSVNLGPGDGSGQDTNLYRAAVGRLRTDTAFQVGTTLGIGAVPSGTDAVTITQTVDANSIASTNTNASGNTSTPHLRLQSVTTSSLAWTTRTSIDTASRFLADMTGKMQWGDGTAAKDVNLYRSAAGTLKTDTAFTVGGAMTVTGALTVAGAGLGAAPQPSDQGLLTWSADPFGATQDRPLSDGVLYLHKVKLNPGGLVSNVVLAVSVAGAALANCYVSLFDSSGTQLAVSADISTTLQTTGVKTIPFAVAYTATAGTFHVGVQVGSHGATSPSIRGGTGTIGLVQAGGAAPYRFSQTGSGLTAAPSSFTPGSVSISAQPLWVGLS